eukprot:CAMPEP_0115430006 /NCGR_PEP_ID=MMETSP0271-20121206/30818_1 /TAXON_ID=71861 /ORGANISM="Scrippsiella trochoidea, Strain CCMP3099" /LENGTH=863 /DNA_ID=CAMNT_0002855213 /DNA_START=20 /DNA_END=2607 /DNA_ORIENTATION=-
MLERLEERLSPKSKAKSAKSEAEANMDEEETHPDAHEEEPSESDPGQSLLQFSSSMYIALETEDAVKIEVMRMGNTQQRSTVHYSTKPGTAKEGINFESTKGVLEFEEGDIEKHLYVPLKRIGIWKLGTEFSIHLLNDPPPENATLSIYTHFARVKILDMSTFPAERFSKNLEGPCSDTNYLRRLLLGYIRWNWRHSPAIRSGTVKMLILAALNDLYILLKFYVKLLLVDTVLTGKVSNPLQHLAELAAAVVVPYAILHLLAAWEVKWAVAGKSRMVLQKALLTKFLNYEEEKREEMNSADLVIAVVRDVEHLVVGGYIQMVKLWEAVGKLLVLLIYQMTSPYISGSDVKGLRVQPFPLLLTMLFPLFLITFLCLRARITNIHVREMDDMQVALASQVSRIYGNYRMIADYSRRPFFENRFVTRIQEYNKTRQQATTVLLNNNTFPGWISIIAYASYMVFAGLRVIDDTYPADQRLSLGLYVTTLDLINTMGTAWQDIYKCLLEMQGSFPALTVVVSFINRSTTIVHRMESGRSMREETRNQRGALRQTVQSVEATSGSGLRVDMMSIKVSNLVVAYGSNPLHTSKGELKIPGEMSVNQGELVCLVGPIGHGKSTVLKVLGGALFSTSGTTFVPAHLRLLHVSHEPMFFSGSLYENLIFGCTPNHPDAAVERVAAVCRRLGIPEEFVAEVAKGKDGAHNIWREVLSHTYKVLFHIARALVANPEVLILHKPLMALPEASSAHLVKIFREFCDKKGIEQDPSKVRLRRPRTCIFTCSRTLGLLNADKTFLITAESGIQELDGQVKEDFQAKQAHEHLTDHHLERLRNRSTTGSTQKEQPDEEHENESLTLSVRDLEDVPRAIKL